MSVDYDDYRRYHVDYVPVRHRRKDLYRLDVRLDRRYREAISAIRGMDAELGGYVLTFEDYRNLVQEAHAMNVHWSTMIEGNRMSLEQVEGSSRMITGSDTIVKAADPGDQQEILNHLYSYFMKDEFGLPWTAETVSNVHRFLMEGTEEDCIPGAIRGPDEEVHVVAGDQEVFIGCPSVHVSEELDELLGWVDDSPYDSVVTAVVFFHEFESIHPFVEGNGRTGCSMFHVLMQELGFVNFNLCKVEDKILKDGDVYYGLLRYTDKTGDYTPIIRFFIDCIRDAYEEAVQEFGERDVLKDLDPDSRQLAISARSRKNWFSLRDASDWIGGVGEQTVRNRLNLLVDMGVFEKKGRTRSTVYRFEDPFRNVKEALSGLRRQRYRSHRLESLYSAHRFTNSSADCGLE